MAKRIIPPDGHVLHQRLIDATCPIGQALLSSVLMINDHRYPWVLLVPRVAGVEELHDLDPEQRALLIEEIASVTRGMQEEFSPVRINVADIGNRVAALHVHIVARQVDDAAWPHVVWSRERQGHEDGEALRRMLGRLRHACRELSGFVPSLAAMHEAGR